MKIKLHFPSALNGSPPIGRAEGEARITKAQIIVESAQVVWTLPGRGDLRIHTPIRFDRRTLFRIPRDSRIRSWQLSESPETERRSDAEKD